MKFVLEIQIGNEATLGDANLADILAGVAKDVAWKGVEDNRCYYARDLNGKIVGHYGRYSGEGEA